MSRVRAAFLGPEGTVSDESAQYFFQQGEVDLVPYKLITDVFNATSSGETDFSIIPIENTIDGSVSLHVDLLVHDADLPIQAEWLYPSIQNLIGPTSLKDYRSIKKVLSHPVVFAQCKEFLTKHLPGVEMEPVSSTAAAVRLVKNQQEDKGYAAIGTYLASQKYELEVLAKGIQNHKNNFTRFILIGNQPFVRETPKSMQMAVHKTSMTVTLSEDRPGALHQVLSAFSWRRLNLTKIESRPTKKQLGNYYFFIDVESNKNDVLLTAAISEIEAMGFKVRVLGNYPSYAYDEVNAEE